MRTIHKFKVPVLGRIFKVTMPVGSVVRHFAIQNGDLFFWAEVDTEAELFSRSFVVVGTGFSASYDGWWTNYLFTCVVPPEMGSFVWHLFEVEKIGAKN